MQVFYFILLQRVRTTAIKLNKCLLHASFLFYFTCTAGLTQSRTK